jgi:hypothetical protein
VKIATVQGVNEQPIRFPPHEQINQAEKNRPIAPAFKPPERAWKQLLGAARNRRSVSRNGRPHDEVVQKPDPGDGEKKMQPEQYQNQVFHWFFPPQERPLS